VDDSNRGDLQRLFMDSLADCSLVLLAVDGEVLTWNAGARALFGYAEAEVVGRNFSCLYGQDDVEAGKPARSLASALSQGRHEETGQRRRKDGTEVKTEDVLIPLYDPMNKLVAFGNLARPADRALQAVRALAAAVAVAGRKKTCWSTMTKPSAARPSACSRAWVTRCSSRRAAWAPSTCWRVATASTCCSPTSSCRTA